MQLTLSELAMLTPLLAFSPLFVMWGAHVLVDYLVDQVL